MATQQPTAAGGGQRGQKGSMTIELVFAVPALFGLFFTGVQAGLVYHARQVVLAAANQAVFAAAGEYGTGPDGAAAATSFLEQVGDDGLTGWSVSAERDATTAVVRITATSFSIMPWSLDVSAVASAPAEELSGSVAP